MEGNSISAVAEQFAADMAKNDSKEAPEGGDAEQETPESETGEPSEEEQGEPSTEEQEETTEEQSEDEESEEKPEVNADEQKIKIKVGDEEREVTLADLKRGYMTHADYTRKTQELASARKTFISNAQQYQQDVQSQVDQLGFLANTFMQQLVDTERTTDWNALRAANPAEYAARQHDMQERRALLQRAYATYQQNKAQQDLIERESMQQHLAEQAELLVTLVPEWIDPRVAAKEKKDLAKYLIDSGVSAEDIETLSDSHTVAMARKAMLYDRLMASKQQAQAKATKPIPKFSKPGPRDPAPKKTEHQRLYQRAAKSGKLDDVAAAFMARPR